MPYSSNHDLPGRVKNNLPAPAQTIYRKAFNQGWKEYEDPQKRRKDRSREETAHRVAWSAVEQTYEKRGDAWKKKT